MPSRMTGEAQTAAPSEICHAGAGPPGTSGATIAAAISPPRVSRMGRRPRANEPTSAPSSIRIAVSSGGIENVPAPSSARASRRPSTCITGIHIVATSRPEWLRATSNAIASSPCGALTTPVHRPSTDCAARVDASAVAASRLVMARRRLCMPGVWPAGALRQPAVCDRKPPWMNGAPGAASGNRETATRLAVAVVRHDASRLYL